MAVQFLFNIVKVTDVTVKVSVFTVLLTVRFTLSVSPFQCSLLRRRLRFERSHQVLAATETPTGPRS